jgi:hypothetical protein
MKEATATIIPMTKERELIMQKTIDILCGVMVAAAILAIAAAIVKAVCEVML